MKFLSLPTKRVLKSKYGVNDFILLQKFIKGTLAKKYIYF